MLSPSQSFMFPRAGELRVRVDRAEAKRTAWRGGPWPAGLMRPVEADEPASLRDADPVDLEGCGKVDGSGVPSPVPPMAALITTYVATSGTLPAPVTVRSMRNPAPSSASTDQINEPGVHSRR